jgi:hypothetical protein
MAMKYHMTYGDLYGRKGYVVVLNGVTVFQSNSKSEAIAEAQRRNGFEPVDGDEQTYVRQCNG